MALDPTYPSVPICNFLAFLLVLLPLPWQLQSWNIGTCMFSLWTAAACLFIFLNTVIWKDNTNNSAPVLCDISSRFFLAFPVAIPACSLTINRRIYKVTQACKLVQSNRERNLSILGDLLLSLGFPLLIVFLYYFVQARRYAIYEQTGCNATYVNTALTVVLLDIWPVVLSALSALYTPFILRAFLRHRREVEELCATSSTFTRHRYTKLVALSCLDFTITLPIGILTLCLSVLPVGTVIPWPGWQRVHAHINEIIFMSSEDWRTSPLVIGISIYGNWISVFWALIFFLLFGTSRDMLLRYKMCLWYVVAPFGVKRLWGVDDELPEMTFEPGPTKNPPRTSIHKVSLKFSDATDTTTSVAMDDILNNDLERDSIPDIDNSNKPFESDQKHTIMVVINSHSTTSTTDFEEEKDISPLSESEKTIF